MNVFLPILYHKKRAGAGSKRNGIYFLPLKNVEKNLIRIAWNQHHPTALGSVLTYTRGISSNKKKTWGKIFFL